MIKEPETMDLAISRFSNEVSNNIGEHNFIKPRSIVNQIYKELSRAISRGILKPGQPLREIELQKWFNTSRAPIREAIRLLEGDGLVIVDTYKKKYVRHITLDLIKETIPVMACLEGYAGNLATKQITEEHIIFLQTTNEAIRSAFSQKKYDECSGKNFNFHRLYVKLSNNQALIKAIRSLMKNSMWLMATNIYYKKSELIPLSIEEHEKIIEAFESGKGQRVEEVIREHVMNNVERSTPSIFEIDFHHGREEK